MNEIHNTNNTQAKEELYGYIDMHALDELWFHTGTACNLSCPFCLEGSKPGDNRLQRININDVVPIIDEACTLGVKQFSFTGGEPFIVKDFIKILDYVLNKKPCMVLTNGTDPLIKRIQKLKIIKNKPHKASFRISIDYANETEHDSGRGAGSFKKALQGIQLLQNEGFAISIARQMKAGEDKQAIEDEYRNLFAAYSIPLDTSMVAFPDLLPPKAEQDAPVITQSCMNNHHTYESRQSFMCAYSRMVVKIEGKMKVFACTLVDDDPFFDLGSSLSSSLEKRIYLKHHRCYSCFAFGASCSERH